MARAPRKPRNKKPKPEPVSEPEPELPDPSEGPSPPPEPPKLAMRAGTVPPDSAWSQKAGNSGHPHVAHLKGKLADIITMTERFKDSPELMARAIRAHAQDAIDHKE